MEKVEFVKCYCFNPLCKSSIFASNKNTTPVCEPLERVLSERIVCKECNSDMVSKPGLEMKSQIHNCLFQPVTSEPIVISKDQLYILI